MKKTIAGVVIVAAIAAGAAFFYMSKGGKTDATITKSVDSVNSVLVIRTDSVDAAIKSLKTPHFTQLDSLTNVLLSIQWTDVKDGGNYQEESKKNFENKKKEVAKLLKKAYDDNNIVTPKIDELQGIIDKQ